MVRTSRSPSCKVGALLPHRPPAQLTLSAPAPQQCSLPPLLRKCAGELTLEGRLGVPACLLQERKASWRRRRSRGSWLGAGWLVMGQTPRCHGAKPDDPVTCGKTYLFSDFARLLCSILHSLFPTFTLKGAPRPLPSSSSSRPLASPWPIIPALHIVNLRVPMCVNAMCVSLGKRYASYLFPRENCRFSCAHSTTQP